MMGEYNSTNVLVMLAKSSRFFTAVWEDRSRRRLLGLQRIGVPEVVWLQCLFSASECRTVTRYQ